MSFAYNKNKPIINNINVEFPRKGIVSVNGPNGVGKSTFLHLLIGFLKPTSGSIFWNKEKYKPRIAYVPQLPFIESTSLKDNIVFGRDLEESAGFNANLKTLNFIDFYEESKNELLGDGGLLLSGGQNQKINIARAIYSDFDVLVLDEPTSAQDALTSTQISSFLKKIAEDKLIIFISHEEDFSSLADYIFSMPDGTLIKNDKN
jgi:ABC-type transport system involved in cytochrome bd biosynthesis fused ATPase/permease subunit